MRFKKLDLNLLVALDALLETESVSGAAERVFLSQPAMSNALSRLRGYFGDPLVVQVGRRMVLTERARSLKPQVREILLRIQQVTQTTPAFDPAAARHTYRIAASDYFATIALPELVRHLSEHAPGIGLDVLPLSPRLFEEVERGDVDLVIVPRQYALKNLPMAGLFEDEWVCLACKGNRLGPRSLTLARYAALEHVVKRENHPNFQPLDERELGHLGISRKACVRIPQYSLVPLLVVGTQRIATVQRRLARWFLAAGIPLKILPCPFPCEPLLESMHWHPVHEADAGHIWLRATIQAVCGKLG